MRLPLVFAAPHRPMFLAGTVQALVAMVFWALELGGRYFGLWTVPPWPLLTMFPPSVLHALLLSCGMSPFFMFGFILTAGPRWRAGSARRQWVLLRSLPGAGRRRGRGSEYPSPSGVFCCRYFSP